MKKSILDYSISEHVPKQVLDESVFSTIVTMPCHDQETVSLQYMFGASLMVAPVTEKGAQTKRVYLPSETAWEDVWTGEKYEGGRWIQVNTPISKIPLFILTQHQEFNELLKIFEKYKLRL